jgi:hypothetical protein
MYFAGFTTLAIVGASIGAIVGRMLNRATTVLLAAIGGAAATAVYQPILGVSVGLAIGSLSATGVLRPVAIALGKCLVATLIGTLAATVALSTYDDPTELPVVAATIMASCFSFAIVALILSVVVREIADGRRMLNRLALRSLLIIPFLFGSWLGISVDLLWRFRSLSGGFPRIVPMNREWLWKGMLDVSFVSINRTTSVSDKDLARIRRFTSLNGLFLWKGEGVTDDGLRNIRDLTGLIDLAIGQAPVSDAGLQHLQGLPRLTTLYLFGTQVTGPGLKYISSPGLQGLYLDGSPIDDDGTSCLQHLVGLRSLSLRFTEITDEGLEHLKNLPSLSYIRLNNTRVGDKGLEKLSSISTLGSMSLAGTQITDDGLRHLARLGGLAHLDLSNTAITDEGLCHLTSLTKLSSLDLQGTHVTATGIQALKTALPNLHVDPPNPLH